jgi:hypothetical protein
VRLEFVTLKEAGDWSLMSRNAGSFAIADHDVRGRYGRRCVRFRTSLRSSGAMMWGVYRQRRCSHSH